MTKKLTKENFIFPSWMTEEMLDQMDWNDKEVRKNAEILMNEQKYNTELTSFLEMMYPWQRKAVNLTKDHKVVGLICGNQMGKSETACALIAMHATGLYPAWYRGRRFKKPPVILVAGVDSNFNKNVLQEKLFGTRNIRGKSQNKQIGTGKIPRSSIIMNSIVSTRGDGIDSVDIKHTSGKTSTIIFKGYEGGREAAQGIPADVVYVDEQPKDEFWSEVLVRTAATQGSVICAFTPLKGLTGLVETLTDLPAMEESPTDKFGSKWKSDGDWAMVRASWDDIEHISEEDKGIISKGFAAYERDARYYGVPIAGFGRVIPYQEDDIIFNHRETRIDPTWIHLIGLDIGHGHGGDPTVAVMVAWNEENDIIYVTDEKSADTPTLMDIARTIWAVNPNVPVAWPNDLNKRFVNSATLPRDDMLEFGVNLLPQSFKNPANEDGKKTDWNHIGPGVHEINARFADGKLMISDNCPILLKQISQWQYDDKGAIPTNQHDDAIDAFRYAVMTIIQHFGEQLQGDNEVFRFGNKDDEDFHFQTY